MECEHHRNDRFEFERAAITAAFYQRVIAVRHRKLVYIIANAEQTGLAARIMFVCLLSGGGIYLIRLADNSCTPCSCPAINVILPWQIVPIALYNLSNDRKQHISAF